ncbi:unnamed protein product [Boreogadus saida]
MGSEVHRDRVRAAPSAAGDEQKIHQNLPNRNSRRREALKRGINITRSRHAVVSFVCVYRAGSKVGTGTPRPPLSSLQAARSRCRSGQLDGRP